MGLRAGGVGGQDRRRVRTDRGSLGAGRTLAFTPGAGEPRAFLSRGRTWSRSRATLDAAGGQARGGEGGGRCGGPGEPRRGLVWVASRLWLVQTRGPGFSLLLFAVSPVTL